MAFLPKPFRSSQQPSADQLRREADQRRGSARTRGYTTAWDRAAKGHLARQPLCIYCAMGAWGEPPRDTAATCVDHLIPHGGDQDIFWRKADWISCCDACHSGPKQRAERRTAHLQILATSVRRFIAAQARAGG